MTRQPVLVTTISSSLRASERGRGVRSFIAPPLSLGIEDSLAKRGYLAILANTDGHLDREAEIAAMLRARGVDGLVLASVEREDKAVSRLDTEGLPIVTVNRRVDDPAISSVV